MSSAEEKERGKLYMACLDRMFLRRFEPSCGLRADHDRAPPSLEVAD